MNIGVDNLTRMTRATVEKGVRSGLLYAGYLATSNMSYVDGCFVVKSGTSKILPVLISDCGGIDKSLKRYIEVLEEIGQRTLKIQFYLRKVSEEEYRNMLFGYTNTGGM